MDAVGPDRRAVGGRDPRVVQRPATRSKGPIDRLLRSLLGMDMKLAQYVNGAAFVGAVVDQIGMARFNAVWTSPETLPTRMEIADPSAWVAPGARLTTVRRTGPRVPRPVRRPAVGLAGRHHGAGAPVIVACSGGADSLALAVAAWPLPVGGRPVARRHGRPRAAGRFGRPGRGHRGRWPGSATRGRGCCTVAVDGPGGPEAAARRARYARAAGARRGPAGGRAAAVLLGHTADDQAETVLLGLARGSGPRSIAGMRPWRPPWGRPLLGVRRADTEAACRAGGSGAVAGPAQRRPGVHPGAVPGEVLPLLEDVLGGGVRPALARTAELMAQDLDALDEIAAAVWTGPLGRTVRWPSRRSAATGRDRRPGAAGAGRWPGMRRR